MEVFNYILLGVYFLSFFFVVFWLITLLTEPESKKAKKLKKFDLVSVVVPAYNEEEHIQKTIKSLINLDYPKEKIEIIVINDGSVDSTKQKTEEIIKQYPHNNIRLINQENKGKGAALNKAISVSSGKYFVCLDADSYPQENALQKILPRFDEGKDVAAVLPCMKTGKGKNLLQKIQRYEYIVNMFYKEMMARLDCIRVTPGPFSVYSREILVKVGGFDENNLTEDLEMALRLQKNNYRILQTLETSVYTIPPATFKQLLKQRNRWYKGSVLNTIGYKKMIFKKKFGDFGMMQMPLTLISGVMTISVVLGTIYYALKPLFNKLYKINLVGFDLSSSFTNVKRWFINFNVLDLNFVLIVLSIAMAITAIYVLKKSHVSTQEKVFKQGIVPLVIYTVAYFFILGIVWINIAVDLMLKRKQKW